MRVASSEIFSLMLSLRLRSTALWDSRLRRRFSFAIIALCAVPAIRHSDSTRSAVMVKGAKRERAREEDGDEDRDEDGVGHLDERADLTIHSNRSKRTVS